MNNVERSREGRMALESSTVELCICMIEVLINLYLNSKEKKQLLVEIRERKEDEAKLAFTFFAKWQECKIEEQERLLNSLWR